MPSRRFMSALAVLATLRSGLRLRRRRRGRRRREGGERGREGRRHDVRRPRARRVRRVDRSAEAHAARHRRVHRAAERGDARGGAQGVAERARRLRRDRAVSLLRRADRRSRGRAGGPDQRLADGRGLRRLRRGQAEGRASSTTARGIRRSRPTSSSRPTSGAARRTSRRAGTRSSSCCGARTDRRTAPARGRRATTRRAPNAKRRADVPAAHDAAADRRPGERRDQWAKADGAVSHGVPRRSRACAARIMRGIGALAAGELAGERMAVAFESAEQEDEHSCFSDNTNADVVNDIKGIRMVYLAEFRGDLRREPARPRRRARRRSSPIERRARSTQMLAKAQAFPATFETMIAARRRLAPSARRWRTSSTTSRSRARSWAKVARQLDLKVGFEV